MITEKQNIYVYETCLKIPKLFLLKVTIKIKKQLIRLEKVPKICMYSREQKKTGHLSDLLWFGVSCVVWLTITSDTTDVPFFCSLLYVQKK